jgi:hypothetical protein
MYSSRHHAFRSWCSSSGMRDDGETPSSLFRLILRVSGAELHRPASCAVSKRPEVVMSKRDDGFGTDVVKGAIAGLAATWVMGKVTTAFYERQDDSAREREERVRGGKTAYTSAAEKLADRVGISVSEEKLKKAGELLHWGLGMDAGISYALARRKIGAVGRLKGLGFGSVFWLVVDEVANPLLGLTKGPRAFPWQAHARGLAGHLAFGVTTFVALELLDRVS